MTKAAAREALRWMRETIVEVRKNHPNETDVGFLARLAFATVVGRLAYHADEDASDLNTTRLFMATAPVEPAERPQ